MSNDTAIQSLKKRIDDLNQQAWDLRVIDSSKALIISRESVELARTTTYKLGLARALQLLGFCYVRHSKNDEAFPLLEESLALFESLNDLEGRAKGYEYLAIIHRTWGDLGGSLELLFKSLAITEPNNFTEILATSHYQLGVTYKHLGDFEKALDHFYKSMAAGREINNSLFESYSINLIGSIYFENGNYEKALDYYQQGLAIRQQFIDKWAEAGSLDNIGFTYLKFKDYDKAISFCKQSLEISRTTGDKKGQANALIHLAEIYKQKKDEEQARIFSHESLELRKASGDKRGEAEILLFLADLHNAQPENDKNVVEWLRNSLKIAEEIKALDLLSKARYHLYDYYRQKGDFEAALENLDLHTNLEKEFHKNAIDQKVSNLEISHKAEVVSQRNQELTELNARIEKANEELKIEASLERVRTAAMGMKKPDDLLSICEILFAELQLLEFDELRNAMVNIYDDNKEFYLNYDFSVDAGASITRIFYNSHPVIENYLKQIRNEDNAFAEIAITGKELEDWKNYRESIGGLQDRKLENASALYYYFYSIGTGAIGISTFTSITGKQHQILKRFGNAFDLAYKRYTDIEKAEAQARESQIQLALERVRARTMAMQRSEELADVSLILFQQVEQLGIKTWATGFNIWLEGNTSYIDWVVNSATGRFMEPYTVDLTAHPLFNKISEAKKRGDDFYVLEFEGNSLVETYRLLFKMAKLQFEQVIESGFQMPVRQINHYVIGSQVSLMFITFEPYPEAWDIFKRFGIVFEQTYTRFLDLQKAEAQVRESQIQLAMERVRARTMAMQKSNELPEAANLLFQQVQSLGMPAWSAGYCIWDDDKKAITLWMSSEGVLQPSLRMPLTEDPSLIHFLEANQRGESFFVEEVGGEALKSHYVYLRTLPGVKETLDDIEKAGFPVPTFQIFHCAYFSKGFLLFITYEPVPEAHEIFKRFGKVFEQTYTRFLDLEKAEAQAREANIETGLERVRSKTMAMHKSGEVTGVAVSLNEELVKLGFEGGSTIIIINKETGDTEQWTGFSEDKTLQCCYVPYFKHPCHDALVDGWKSGEKFLIYTVAGDEKKSLDEHYFATGYRDFPESDKKWMQQMESVTFSHAFMKYGAIHWGPGQLTDEQLRILQRFSKVFEQSYTRFLDLQKAEAQAREAQ
ncbi:MAG TPA: tetratricopeptide repeat protein, partial [Chitinophagaceae bacterium]|nr:tetratricopeptide repeat protein [Chitinophagaceae bacterium]